MAGGIFRKIKAREGRGARPRKRGATLRLRKRARLQTLREALTSNPFKPSPFYQIILRGGMMPANSAHWYEISDSSLWTLRGRGDDQTCSPIRRRPGPSCRLPRRVRLSDRLLQRHADSKELPGGIRIRRQNGPLELSRGHFSRSQRVVLPVAHYRTALDHVGSK